MSRRKLKRGKPGTGFALHVDKTVLGEAEGLVAFMANRMPRAALEQVTDVYVNELPDGSITFRIVARNGTDKSMTFPPGAWTEKPESDVLVRGLPN